MVKRLYNVVLFCGFFFKGMVVEEVWNFVLFFLFGNWCVVIGLMVLIYFIDLFVIGVIIFLG